MTETLKAGVAFLRAAQNAQGWWRDFRLAPGESDEWVTGYVGSALAGLDDEAANHGFEALIRRAGPVASAWGYNGFTPRDADSTLWALHLGNRLGRPVSNLSLEAHLRPDGGLCTYAREPEIRAFIGLPTAFSMAGWCGSHVCVTAAASQLPGWREAVRPYLLGRQAPDGRWPAYWWHDDEYSTVLAAESIAGREAFQRARSWAGSRIGQQGFAANSDFPDGSPFATAWALRLVADPDRAAAAFEWLRRNQAPDGSWRSSARLRVPPPGEIDPSRFAQWTAGGLIQGASIVDQNRIFTTATVVATLARCLVGAR